MSADHLVRLARLDLAVAILDAVLAVRLAIGAYMLWVCWGDPASKAVFEGMDAPPSTSVG